MSGQNPDRVRSGFTLIELLVVIAIIAILIKVPRTSVTVGQGENRVSRWRSTRGTILRNRYCLLSAEDNFSQFFSE
jgi:prepilin-type N-terminal cleavage/methylation domain-containing protein